MYKCCWQEQGWQTMDTILPASISDTYVHTSWADRRLGTPPTLYQADASPLPCRGSHCLCQVCPSLYTTDARIDTQDASWRVPSIHGEGLLHNPVTGEILEWSVFGPDHRAISHAAPKDIWGYDTRSRNNGQHLNEMGPCATTMCPNLQCPGEFHMCAEWNVRATQRSASIEWAQRQHQSECIPPVARSAFTVCWLSTRADGVHINWIVADSSVNCDDAVQVGQTAIAKMIGKTYAKLTLRRKDKVKSFGAMNNTVRVRREDVVVNLSLLFNRITCILNTSSELDVFLQYELAPQPPALFVDGQMRKSAKSALGNMVKTMVTCQKAIPDASIFVLDGGHLLHAVVWPKPATYQEVCETYKSYILSRYNSGVTVVFDGYAGPISTKSVEQKRRATRCLTPTEWGWQDHDHTIVPVATDQPAAPRQLMNIVTCGCKTGCGNACGCRKAGMVCSEMCYHCMGVSCDNAPEMDLDSQ